MANVDGWIDFLLPLRRSLVGFGGVDVEEDGPGLGHYRHDTCYQAPNATTCNSNTLKSTSSSCLSPFIEHEGAVDVKSQRLVPGSAQQPSPMGRCTFEGPKDQSGNDHVEFVRTEQALGGERGLGGVEKELAGAAQDEESMSTEKGGSVWIERSIPGGRLAGCVIDQGED